MNNNKLRSLKACILASGLMLATTSLANLGKVPGAAQAAKFQAAKNAIVDGLIKDPTFPTVESTVHAANASVSALNREMQDQFGTFHEAMTESIKAQRNTLQQNAINEVNAGKEFILATTRGALLNKVKYSSQMIAHNMVGVRTKWAKHVKESNYLGADKKVGVTEAVYENNLNPLDTFAKRHNFLYAKATASVK
jgi:hypothetical protein